MKLNILFLIVFGLSCGVSAEEVDYYKLLGVNKDATVKEVRKAFKTLAVKLHPDKNQDDKNSEQKFIKLARAYEVLKDPESRKQYDLHGDPDVKTFKKNQYHSYTYYRDQFGLYDDDPLIVTLSRSDYEVNILDQNQAWFVNFYSTSCHHCHDLAPIWRKLAAELEGVVRIAAVNCEEDAALCYQLRIQSFPTLLYYEKESHFNEGEKFKGERSLDMLKSYVLSKITLDIKDVTASNWNEYRNEQWLLFLCSDDNVNCPEHETMLKLGAILEGLMPIGYITNSKLCDEILPTHKNNPIVFWQIDKEKFPKVVVIDGSDTKEIVDGILNNLPNPETLDEEKFKEIRINLRAETDKPWLICFYMGPATELNLQLKRLPTLIPDINLGLVHCGKSSTLCGTLHVARYPTWGVLKVGGAFEIHHGRDVLYDIASFARDSVTSTNLHALSPADFYNLVNQGSTWFIDWYAPWCPPCRKLMPEIRKASQKFDPEQVQFGTVDCTLHKNLCVQEGVTAYPTTVLYNNSNINKFHGVLNEQGIVEFIQDMLSPVVINLDENSFEELKKKPEDEIWVVDFYAPWCGPCQRLGPEWRKLAKNLQDFKEIKIAQVDCVANSIICHNQNINGYPTIRLYPLGGKGLNSVAIYNGNRDATALQRWIISFLPSPVETLTPFDFEEQILTTSYEIPWLVDFYAPWCGHCVHFEPAFRSIAKKLEGSVKTGKIDCEKYRHFCAKLHVNGYPTLIFYLSSTENYRIESQDSTEIIKQVRKYILKSKSKHDEL